MKRLLVLTVAVIFTNMPLLASDITPLQIMFVAKTMFPEATDVTVFISGKDASGVETTFGRAASQTQLTPKVFIIDDTKGVGEAVRQVGDGSIILMLNGGVLNEKSTQLFILKKCKEKQADLITTSKDYATLGALAGLYKDETAKLAISLNLKHNAHLAGKFTPEFQEKLRVKEVIE
jgi:ABC-type uncharacterized transport system substrate-binding protein